MLAPVLQTLTIRISGTETVSALLCQPQPSRACYVLAHGAGAGMTHGFMASVAQGLAERGIATLRYQFPYMERGSKRPDSPRIAHAAVRAAVAAASTLMPGVALFAGGKSFGGRMTSQAQAKSALPHVRGLIFLGFPLHPAKQPSQQRAEHLSRVGCPMLFLQGTRDELADIALIIAVTERLGELATLQLFDDADHSFHVRARSGRTYVQVLDSMLDTIAEWITAH
ncbi:MAG TPA: alpha/beta family hydrolase [Burkholderiaceae bacterium]|nr:alpha/beta family hydrolase [Burkholderiaceae bacterium]